MKKNNDFPSPEISEVNSAKSSFNISLSSEESEMSRNRYRSKSLSHLIADNYTIREVHRIKERLLRTNSRLERSALKSFTRNQKLSLISLALVDFISFCSMSIMAPFFPKEASEKGLTDTMSGFIFSFYALVMFLTSPIFGKLLPKFGAKVLFLSGMFVAGVCNLLFAFLEYVSDYTLFTTFCFIIRGFEALGASAFCTASYVFVVDTFPQNIGSVLGILETFVGLGMSVGPALGGVLYSLGGFSLPFFVLGVTMIVFVPLNIWLLPVVEDSSVSSRTPSLLKILKVPTVIITGLVVVIISGCWSFLDPTLEPHLREFNLTAEKVGLIFLLFSALYGISSPMWGWLADKLNKPWILMVSGLFMSTIGLLLLGPCPYLTFLPRSLWLDIVALSILGISVALALLPTLQGLLESAIQNGCGDSLSTYSIVAGVWSCLYSLGEVVGPSLGGLLLEHYGFAIASSIMASMTLILGIVALLFFVISNNYCNNQDNASDSGISGSWQSGSSDEDSLENTPLLLSNVNSAYRMYTEDKIQYYEQSRKQDNEMGDNDFNQITDVRGTVTITGMGACEV